MTTLSVSPADLDLLLELGGTIDTPRAQLLLDLATEACSSIVSPVPANARSVVLTVAARAYTNPTGVTAQTVGPTSVQYGASGAVGIYLDDEDVAQLNRLTGEGGAFSVNPTPPCAGQGLPWWDRNTWGFGDGPGWR